MRVFNKQQKNYMMAKALLEALEEESNQVDRDYIKANNIVNEDGSIPRLVYAIDDQATFDKANAECSKTTNDNGLWNQILKARETLKQAEDALVTYGLSIVPTRERATLTKAAHENYTARIKIIELVMKLDATTVTA